MAASGRVQADPNGSLQIGATFPFGHDHAVVKVRKAADFPVGRAVTSGKIASVYCVVPDGAQAAREPSR